MDQYTNLTNLITKLNTWKDNMAAIFGADDEYVKGIAACCTEIEKAPVADVEEVRHGEWIPIEQTTHWADTEIVSTNIIGFRCSLCGAEEKFKYKYCHCGAIMDEKKQ